MTLLVLKSWLLLLYLDGVMRFRPFRVLHRLVRECPVRARASQRWNTEELCHAVDLACVFYFKQVLCLQRSAATTLLLRSYGWKAAMLIGAQVTPPEFHAWVEVGEKIVNDRPYIRDLYLPLETC